MDSETALLIGAKMNLSKKLQRGTATLLLVLVPLFAILAFSQSSVGIQAGEVALGDASSIELANSIPAMAPTDTLSDWQYTGYWSWIWVWQWVRVKVGKIFIWKWIKIKKSIWCR